ncbi:hypothetical protein ACC703_38560, partial [Rhizobium ruizarguesonis]
WQIRLSPNWYLSDPHFFQQSVIVTQVATWKIRLLFCVLIHGLHLGQPKRKLSLNTPYPSHDEEPDMCGLVLKYYIKLIIYSQSKYSLEVSI